MKILEHYARLEPRRDVRRSVSRALQAVPQGCLSGLGTILLRDIESLGRRERATRIVHRGKKVSRPLARGVYRKRTGRQAASIELFIDNIFAGWPAWATRIAILRDFLIVRTLYHEIGHHIHVAIRPTKGEQEDLADRISHQFSRDFFRRFYRHYRLPIAALRTALLPIQFIIRQARKIARRQRR